MLRADNDGEGGIMALAALARRAVPERSTRRTSIVVALGVLGASLFYGDSAITPAISVLSAVEGLKTVSPNLSEVVVPAAVVVLAALFAVQRWGTGRVGRLFGPIMLLWFAVLGATGIREVVNKPGVLAGLSPTYAAALMLDRPGTAFFALGAVVLSVTGAEALYADMGHFGRSPIRRTWFLLVFPALTLNYLAQGALILRDPSGRENPFFLLLPASARMPMVLLATAATVIAAQAVISGAFSISRQAVRLGFLPRLRIRHTSAEQQGQVYLPGVNRGLFVAALVLTLTFASSTRLAAAYGVAVTGTFLVTTGLFMYVAHGLWKWSTWRVAVLGVCLGLVELAFFSANLTKIPHGGWLTVLIAGAVFTVMSTWRRGREMVTVRRRVLEGPLDDVVRTVRARQVHRVPGVAVFPHAAKETAPLALRANIEHNRVVHEQVVIISGRTEPVPHIPWSRRFAVESLGDPQEGILRVDVAFGFQDKTDFPEVLRRALERDHGGVGPGIDLDKVSYFVSHIAFHRSGRPGMSAWRTRLFMVLAHNSASQADFLHLPVRRTVIMGEQVDI
jgi:KUP system potassium uptake protein